MVSGGEQGFDSAKFHMERGNLKDVAFDLHQTVERLYHCVLLVCTFYTPHNHNIALLRTQAEGIEELGQAVQAVCSEPIAALEQAVRDAA